MPRLIALLAIAVPLALLAAVPAAAQGSDSAAVVAVAQAALRAISTRDTAAARRVMLPGAVLMAVRAPDDPASAPRVQSDTTFYAQLATSTQSLTERMWAPTVLLHGTVAEVHAPYDFHIDGKFSHCGTDVFTLVRAKGEWRIASIIYTVQRAGCAASPLGPLTP